MTVTTDKTACSKPREKQGANTGPNDANRRPIIGVMPLFDFERDSFWMLPGYLNMVEHAGGMPVTLPLLADEASVTQALSLCDGLLFTGGHDVDPRNYGEVRSELCGQTWPERDRMEMALLTRVLAEEKPFLGICRGIQILNVSCGGTLWQDLPAERPSAVMHQQCKPYDRPVHNVSVHADTLLARVLGNDTDTPLHVNSYHHQGVKDVGHGLVASAYAPDGLVEALEVEGHPFGLAVQWHPEFFGPSHPASLRLFEAFVKSCSLPN